MSPLPSACSLAQYPTPQHHCIRGSELLRFAKGSHVKKRFEACNCVVRPVSYVGMRKEMKAWTPKSPKEKVWGVQRINLLSSPHKIQQGKFYGRLPIKRITTMQDDTPACPPWWVRQTADSRPMPYAWLPAVPSCSDFSKRTVQCEIETLANGARWKRCKEVQQQFRVYAGG